MIGARIRKLRIENGMTQKNLADKLFVSAQAVSRWENDEVEPSISTIMELAKIFNISADEILGLDDKDTSEKNSQDTNQSTQNEEKYQEPPRQFLAVCEKCNKPIYTSEEIVRKDRMVFCKKCHEESERIRKLKEAQEHQRKVEAGYKRRKFSFIFGPLPTISIIFCVLCATDSPYFSIPSFLVCCAFAISMFTFVSCCILNNNFVGFVFLKIATFTIEMPGLIFAFDLEGCLWAIGMKLLLTALGFIFGILMLILGLCVGGFLSLFVYPYAIITNIKHPEKTFLDV